MTFFWTGSEFRSIWSKDVDVLPSTVNRTNLSSRKHKRNTRRHKSEKAPYKTRIYIIYQVHTTEMRERETPPWATTHLTTRLCLPCIDVLYPRMQTLCTSQTMPCASGHHQVIVASAQKDTLPLRLFTPPVSTSVKGVYRLRTLTLREWGRASVAVVRRNDIVWSNKHRYQPGQMISSYSPVPIACRKGGPETKIEETWRQRTLIGNFILICVCSRLR